VYDAHLTVHSPVTRHYISSRVCNQSHSLRQFTDRKCAENLHRQIAAGHERCGASHQRHTRIRPWSDATSTRRSALAGLPTAYHVQAVSAGVQVFTRLCTAISCRVMCTGRRRHRAPQSALSHSKSTKFPSVQHDKLWPTSIFVRRPSSLELTTRTSATNHFNRPFQALSKNVFIQADIALSALETFLFSGLYKFTYLLTYLLSNNRQSRHQAHARCSLAEFA